MASVVIDPTDRCIQLVCGAGESDVTFTAQEIYSRWSDWLLLSDNLKYLPAFDSGGGAAAGTGTTDIVYTLLTDNGWLICPKTTESSVRVVITGDLYPDIPANPMFGYDEVVSGGHTHIEQRVTTSARVVTTGGSAVLPGDITDIAAAVWAKDLAPGFPAERVQRLVAAAVAGTTSGQKTAPVFQAIDGSGAMITATVDANGNRTSVTVAP